MSNNSSRSWQQQLHSSSRASSSTSHSITSNEEADHGMHATIPPPPAWTKKLDLVFIGGFIETRCVAMASERTADVNGVMVSSIHHFAPQYVILVVNQTVFSFWKVEQTNDSAEEYDEVPDDILPEVAVMSDTDVALRFKHMACFDRRTREERNSPIPQKTVQEFKEKLNILRSATSGYGTAGVEKYFVEQMNRRFPGQLLVKGVRMRSSQDFKTFIKYAKWDDTMQEIVLFAQKQLWDNNSWAIEMENEFCKVLRFRFTGERCDGTRMKRNHDGKCFAKVFVKCKGTLVDSIRVITKEYHGIALYARRARSTKRPGEEIGAEGTHITRKPRKVPKVMRVDSGSKHSHVGYCEGHPAYIANNQEATTKSSAALDKTTTTHLSDTQNGKVSATVDKPLNPSYLLRALLAGNLEVDDLRQLLQNEPRLNPSFSKKFSFSDPVADGRDTARGDLSQNESDSFSLSSRATCDRVSDGRDTARGDRFQNESDSFSLSSRATCDTDPVADGRDTAHGDRFQNESDSSDKALASGGDTHTSAVPPIDSSKNQTTVVNATAPLPLPESSNNSADHGNDVCIYYIHASFVWTSHCFVFAKLLLLFPDWVKLSQDR